MTYIYYKEVYYNLICATSIQLTLTKVEIQFPFIHLTITDKEQIKKIAYWLQSKEIL